MTEAAQVETPAERKRAEASNFLAIVRGRLPLIFVHAIRFSEVLNAMSNKELAAKFSTSVGKVFDIKKVRNFSYVGKDFMPTAEDVKAAEDWITSIGVENVKGMTSAGDKTLLQSTLDEYKERGLATAEQAAAQSAVRGATRKPKESASSASNGAAQSTGESVAQSGDAADGLLG